MAGNIASMSSDDALLQDDVGTRGKKPSRFTKSADKSASLKSSKRGKKKKGKKQGKAKGRPPMSAVRRAMAPAAPTGAANC